MEDEVNISIENDVNTNMEDDVNIVIENDINTNMEDDVNISIKKYANIIKYQKIPFNSKNYPVKIRSIKDSPRQIYVAGNLDLLNECAISVIGSRTITEYGIKCCEKICKEISLRNIPIVSGMAVGTDTLAHEVALYNHNKTIAVLPCGFENIYPKENEDLFFEIIENNGLVISEYAPETKATSDKFLKRNRIVSALGECLLVIEATYRSGTSVTAKIAKSQGKKVFAVPGDLDKPHSVGTNNLIKQGAFLLTCADDIFKEFEEFRNRKVREDILKNEINEENQLNIKNEYKVIYNLILKNEVISLEEIIEKTKMTAREVIRLLVLMEMDNLIVQDFGVGYKINTNY